MGSDPLEFLRKKQANQDDDSDLGMDVTGTPQQGGQVMPNSLPMSQDELDAARQKMGMDAIAARNPAVPMSRGPLMLGGMGNDVPPSSSTVSTDKSGLLTASLGQLPGLNSNPSDEDSDKDSDEKNDIASKPMGQPTSQQQGMPTLNFGNNTQGTVANLQAAQDAQNKATMINTILKGGNQIAAGMSKTTPNSQGIEENIHDAQQIVSQFKDRVAQEGDDPNSGLSKGLSEYAKQFGVNVQGASANQVAKVMPFIFKGYEASETRKARSEDLKYKYNALAVQKQAIAALKGDKDQNAAAKDAINHINSSRDLPDVKQARQDQYNIKKALDFIPKDPNNMSSQELQLLNSEVGKIATGGVPTENQISHLDPGTFRKMFGQYLSKVDNSVEPAKAGEFVKRYQAYLQTLDKGAVDTINRHVNDRLNASKKQLGEDNYNSIKNNYQEKYYQSQQSSNNPDANKIKIFRANNPSVKSDEEAAKILKENGHI